MLVPVLPFAGGRVVSVIWPWVLSGASSAEPHDREVSEARFVTEPSFDLLADGVEVLDGDRCDLLAAFAIEVFELLAADQHVESGSVAEMDVANEAVTLEQLKVAVDRGGVDREFARELLGGHGTFCGEQCF
jgi:hypothetical protein